MSYFRKEFKWTSPLKNNWTYEFIIDDPKAEDFEINSYCLFLTEHSYAVIILIDAGRYLYYYTGHFFTRYVQRMGCNGRMFTE